MTTYAVTWQEAGGPIYLGKLHIEGGRLELDGAAADLGAATLTVPLHGVSSLAISRAREHRLRGLPVLCIDRRGTIPLWLSSVEGIGMLREIEHRLETERTSRVS